MLEWELNLIIIIIIENELFDFLWILNQILICV